MGEAGFEPAKAEPPDLQSGPFGRSGIPPDMCRSEEETLGDSSNPGPVTLESSSIVVMELAVGLEPTTPGLQNRSSAN